MGYRLRKIVLGVLIACVSVTTVYAQPTQLTYDGKTHQYNLPPIELFVNDVLVETPLMPPIQLEGRTLVPAREVCEALGANVEYKANEKKIYIDYADSLILLEPNNKEVWIDGEIVVLDVPAKIVNEKIMVPVRFVGEALGGSVNWIGGDTRAVYIYKQADEPEIEKPEIEKPEIEKPEIEKPDIEEPDNSLEDLFGGIIEHYKGTRNRVDNNVKKESHEVAKITKVETVAEGNNLMAVISANGPITDVEVSKDNGKVIVDIKNSKSGLDGSIKLNDNKYIYNVRTSQFTTDTTRVVFDLKSGAEVSVDLSRDRKEIMINLQQQELGDIIYGTEKGNEYIAIENFVEAQVVVSDYKRSKVMTIYLPNTKIEEAITWEDLDGEFVQNIYAVNEDTTAVIMIEIDAASEYIHTLKNVEGNLVINFKEPTFKNINYVGEKDKYIELKMPEGMSVDDIKVIDNYQGYELIIDLGDDYSKYFGDGIIPVDDSNFKNITVSTVGNTQIKIGEKLIHTVEFEEDGDKLYIKLLRPQEKYDKILLLDIGHGGTDGGTTGNSLQEKNINMLQAKEIIKRLEKQTDIKIYTTRDTDKTLTLQYRTELGNNIGADIFVSVHNNSVTKPSVSGSEVFYFENSKDSRSKRMAEITINNIINAVGTVNRGAKAGNGLYVLRTSKMPAILLEGGFVSNPAEAQRLQSKEFTEAYAQAVVDSIVEIFDTMSFE